MLKQARLEQIADLVATRGQVTVTELSSALSVSEATIRRDLDELAGWGRIRRAHGGAVRAAASDREPPLVVREAALVAEKRRIGRAAAELVSSGDRIFLGGGTTVASMADHLEDKRNLTVITNSLPIAGRLAERTDIELIVIGGVLRHSEQSMVSQIAERMIDEFRVDTVFMGVRAVDVAEGLTVDSVAEAAVDRAILRIGRQRVVLADHSKFGRSSTVRLVALGTVDIFVTDAISESLVREVAELGAKVVVAA
jgi:DeoR/GlpR family transcriptional regulator of sugar metabolism